MSQPTTIPCAILAGGQSRRFGSPKGLLPLGGTPLIQRVKDIVTSQTSGDVIINTPCDGPYATFGQIIVEDPDSTDYGPLGGLLSVLEWGQAKAIDAIATVSLDTPFMPQNLLADLAASTLPAIATSNDRDHHLISVWPSSLAGELFIFLNGGGRAVRDWIATQSVTRCAFPMPDGVDPFFNINTPDDLAAAEHYLAAKRAPAR